MKCGIKGVVIEKRGLPNVASAAKKTVSRNAILKNSTLAQNAKTML
jgi:hypothetical protein